MSGGITQILAIGAQDVYLTQNPEVSFFRSNYKRYSHFAQSVERQTIQSVPGKGTMSSIFVERKGDLLSYMYLTAQDPSNNSIVSNINWSQTINYIELYIGGQLIDRQDDTFIKTIEPVTLTDTYSKRYAGSASAGTNTFYPLKFFFCKDFQTCLPLVGMQFQQVEIRIYWSTAMNPALRYDMWANYIYLDGPERDYFTNANGTIDMLVWQVQRQLVPNDYSADLAFSQPVKFICGNVLAYTSGFQTLISTINGTDIGVFRGLPHYQEVVQYFHTPQGYNNTGGLVPAPVFILPYCLDTAKLQPTGTINFSRIDTFRLRTDSSTGTQLSGTTPAIFAPGSYVYAINYNVLRVQAGMAALLYAN